MFMRPASLALALLLPVQAVAQQPGGRGKVPVCWADSIGRCPPEFRGKDVTFFACGSGGHSGYNPTYVCLQICGQPPGPNCKGVAGPGGGGGRCGYRAATIECSKP